MPLKKNQLMNWIKYQTKSKKKKKKKIKKKRRRKQKKKKKMTLNQMRKKNIENGKNKENQKN